MDRQHNRKLGGAGEEIAATWLATHGFRVIARNLRTPYGELDILAEKDCELHVIEVKTRSAVVFGDPMEAITPSKQEHLRRSAQVAASLSLPGLHGPVRSLHIDAVSVLFHRGAAPAVTFVPDILA